jgi:hypothetical protein
MANPKALALPRDMFGKDAANLRPYRFWQIALAVIESFLLI